MTGFGVFGGQTVDFVKVTDGAKDRFGHPAETETSMSVSGCMFRVLSQSESEELTTRAVERVRCTAPANSVTIGMTARDLLRYSGITYRVVGGSRVCRDLDGVVSHVVAEAVRDVA